MLEPVFLTYFVTFLIGNILSVGNALICPGCMTLEDIVAAVKSSMPTSDSNLYAPPEQEALDEWEQVVGEMMSGSCVSNRLPPSLVFANYELQNFKDADTGRNYCVLAPSHSYGVNDSSWGMVIIDIDYDSPVKPKALSIDIPYPLDDDYTGEEGVFVFKWVHAKSFVISGSHSNANNDVPSLCDDRYKISDAGHTISNFQSSVLAILEHYKNAGLDHTAIQFHGMRLSTCPDVDAFLTHGKMITPTANEKIDMLRKALVANLPPRRDPYVITVPGDLPSCDRTGTTNVQGRLLNGVSKFSVCNESAWKYTSRFIHIQQKPFLREQVSSYQAWVNAINSINFTIAERPMGFDVTSPENVAGTESVIGHGTTVTIKWDSHGIDPSQQVKLSVNLNDTEKTYVKTIVNRTPNDGTYHWRVPASQPLGDNFIIRIRSVSNVAIKDFSSQTFSVINPIAVRAPNGGEELLVGENVTIQWSAPGIGNVKIALHDRSSNSYIRAIAKEVANTGFFRWTIPNSILPGTEYVVKVRSVHDTSVKDYSDGVFSIGIFQ